MKIIRLKLVFLSLVIGIASASGSVLITTFGNADPPTFTINTDFTSLATTQNASLIEFTGNANQELDGGFQDVDISQFSDMVRLSGSLSSAAPSANISIDLFSGASFGRYEGSSWSDFSSQGFVDLSFQSSSGQFNTNAVDGFLLRGTGLNTESLNGQFTSLQAIPEPSSYTTIAGLLGLAYAVCRRRRRCGSMTST